MTGSVRILGPDYGPLNAPLMFAGETPGRSSTDDPYLPFHGDKSGHNLERLTEQVGTSRCEVFVTGAVLCNPEDERGNNATPTSTEVASCAPLLRETVEILGPSIVVTLGAVALKTYGGLEAHLFSLRDQMRTNNPWMHRPLIPAYYPGQQAMVHRSLANQLSDYQFVAEALRRLKKPRKRPVSTRPRPDTTKLR